MKYTPITLAHPDDLFAQQYREAADRVMLEAGLDLYLRRRKARPEFPFFDTKFNPNTGEDFPESSYDRLTGWFLGRGAEACAAHLDTLEDLYSDPHHQQAVRQMLTELREHYLDALMTVLERYGGSCPFIMDRSYQAADPWEAETEAKHKLLTAGTMFCAKGLLAIKDPRGVLLGKRLVRDYVDAAYVNRYAPRGNEYEPDIHAQSSFMLAFGAIPLVMDVSDAEEQTQWAQLTADMLTHVIDTFYEPETGIMYDYVDFRTGVPLSKFNPGHLSELVGLALQAADAVSSSEAEVSPHIHAVFNRAYTVLPSALVRTWEAGYCNKHHGIYQFVDITSGTPIQTDLPWWSLPETMRAALRSAVVTDDVHVRTRLQEIYVVCSNDYFSYYINPAYGLFPFRTRSGENGRVLDSMPVLPEADPLYHTNLAWLDARRMLDKVGR